MPTSLYDLSVPTFLQTVKAIGDFLDLAVRHCADTRTDPDDFVHARGSSTIWRPSISRSKQRGIIQFGDWRP